MSPDSNEPGPRANDTVGYELDGHVATITYNRPAALNTINGEMRRGLNAAFDRFRTEEDAWVAICLLYTSPSPRDS